MPEQCSHGVRHVREACSRPRYYPAYVADHFDVHVSPEPSSQERDAILVAVRETLRREADLARPAMWRLQGWTHQRVGLTDVARFLPEHRRWALSARMPLGGRVFPGLNGRGDTK